MNDNPPQQKSLGKVTIVGAGPGDPELITVKGLRAMEQCDVLLYDYLVDERILVHLRTDCERVCVGKRPGMHSMEQSAINQLLIQYARKGFQVVRLKGGDPFIFGRGGEEVEALKQEGIRVEVIPGITAALAASASLQIPLTHRDHASSLLFVTGHEDPEKHEPQIDWQRLQAPDSTIVLYMGMKHLARISEELIVRGRSPHTPVVVLQWISTPNERTLRSTLRAVADDAVAGGFGAPAVVIIGNVLGE
jgi:uroporphyrin-III C-methyltransferase